MADKERYIVHVDMDAFFASVEQRDTPEFRDKPVIVGSDPKSGKGRGVVAACSYEARKYGIHSAMPISIAYNKCPRAVFLRPDFKKYVRASHHVFDILERFTPEIEPISIDEAFLDITGSYAIFGSPHETCRMIKDAIKKETGLPSSIGMAPNKMTAKIASDIGKPDGFTEITEEGLSDFLHPLPVGKLWGVGEKTLEHLKKFGINTIGDLAMRREEEMEQMLGKNGKHLWELANGMDPRAVESSGIIKSISNEHTFDEDVTDWSIVKDTLMFLSEKVSRRLRKSDFKGRTITLKIRFSDFKTYTRAVTVQHPTNFADEIYGEVSGKLADFKTGKRPVRLVGVRVSNLSDVSVPADLFYPEEERNLKKERLHKALDRIADKFGQGAVHRRSA
jgi:nucleotidyltransferase/DNA polymerase involved in DNA repair